MIEVRRVHKAFNDKIVLDDVSLILEKGKVNMVIGGSGSGKTVLMKCMVGLHEVDKGMILYAGRNFSEMTFRERKPIRQEIGMIFQGGALFDSLTVEENVTFPLSMFSSKSPEEKRDRANFCLNRVNLNNVGHLYPAEISGGMKKRVAIARAISMQPDYLFCDEPNSGLDPMTSLVIDNLIQEITQEYNITTIVNTHDMNSVMEVGDHLIFLHKGKKAFEGTWDDIIRHDDEELNNFIFASRAMKKLKQSQ